MLLRLKQKSREAQERRRKPAWLLSALTQEDKDVRGLQETSGSPQIGLKGERYSSWLKEGKRVHSVSELCPTL